MLHILCGPAAAGKDSLLKTLEKRGYIPIISTTSRPKRVSETEGVEYKFVTKEYFEEQMAKGEFAECRKYTAINEKGDYEDWYYGCHASDLRAMDPEKDYIIILDMNGIRELKKFLGSNKNIIVCYLDAPDTIRRKRAEGRGSFNIDEWSRRVVDDREQFNQSAILRETDMVLDNSMKYKPEDLAFSMMGLANDYQERAAAIKARKTKTVG